MLQCGPVVMGNVGDNSVSSCRLHAVETQQLSYVSMAVANATPSVARGAAVD